jgi:phage head-tail adaptor, putative, SPP1 family
MTIGSMRQRVNIQTLAANPVQEASGLRDLYTTIATVWASVEPVSGNTEFASKQIGEEVTHRVVIRYRSDVTAENWISWRGRRFRIRKVRDLEERRRYQILDCEEASKENAYVEEA